MPMSMPMSMPLDGKNATKNSLDINLYDSLLAANYLPRPRLDEALEQASSRKLVYVVAGAGYGKTQAVRRFIEQQPDAVVRWVQLTESDNIGSRYWENLTYSISFDNPDLAERLREHGFPETTARFKQFAEIIKSHEHRSLKTFLVLDDFHLIHSEQSLAFAERCAYLQIPGACVIIISRTEPKINVVSLFSKGQVSIVTEDVLRFTDTEISELIKHCGIPFSSKNLPQLIEATKGWTLAIQLLTLALKRMPSNLGIAIDTMKQNIFKLMETEVFNTFPESIQKSMVNLSLISNLPLRILQRLYKDATYLEEAPQLVSFVWFDSLTGEGRVHPLYWEFLRTKRHILTPEEERDTYMRAAEWCAKNNFFLDAVNYFAKSNQHGRILDVLLSHPFKLPHDTCEYCLGILEGIDPGDDEQDDYDVLMLKNLFVPRMLIGMGRYEDARERCMEIIRRWEGSQKAIAKNILYTAYNNLAYVDLFTCTMTHSYGFHGNLKKSVEYFKMSTLPPLRIGGPFAVPDVRSHACLVGEGADMQEFDRFLATARQTAELFAETSHNMYYGYDDLVACELAYYKNEPKSAKNYAHQSVMKASEKKQYSIEAVASQYLLRISLQEGNYSLAKEILRQLRCHLDNPDFWNRQLIHDLSVGYFYAQIGLPELVPPWLAMDDIEATNDVHIPSKELIVSVKSYLALKKYDLALTVLCNNFPREPQERFHLSELQLSLLTAVARLKTGDAPGAVKDLEKAYALSLGGAFEMPFVELGRYMHPLAAAALKQAGTAIPAAWLRLADRKAAIYVKKADVIMNAVKREKNIGDPIQLSGREQEVLTDLYHGLSRDEIAVNRYMSVNTVKKTLQSIYIKLDASNNVDAVRIAIEKKLIELTSASFAAVSAPAASAVPAASAHAASAAPSAAASAPSASASAPSASAPSASTKS